MAKPCARHPKITTLPLSRVFDREISVSGFRFSADLPDDRIQGLISDQSNETPARRFDLQVATFS